MANEDKPNRLTLRSYQVGFGDCFLLTFHYPKRAGNDPFDRHVMIDFGSFPRYARAGGGDHMLAVAEDVERECNGKLHAVVATHRHADHINGFATKPNGKGSGDVIARCKPDVVIQPWTEDPDAAEDATRPTKALPAGHRAFASALNEMSKVCEQVAVEAQRLKEAARRNRVPVGLNSRAIFAAADQLEFIGRDNVKNLSAVENLIRMGRRPKSKAFYVSYGTKSGLEKVLPGVATYVLGPPTLAESDLIRKQRSRDEDEFWQLHFWRFQALSLRRTLSRNGRGNGGSAALFPSHRAKASAGPEFRWFLSQLDAVRLDQMLQIVTALDGQMNNTSVILLFETPKQKLLFPGDAQIENWLYALEAADNSAKVVEKLRDVTLYKVGHHGSLNATPKRLWREFARRGPTTKKRRLVTMVSTERDHHGDEEADTEVPRRTLLTALRKDSKFFSTEDLPAGELKRTIELAL